MGFGGRGHWHIAFALAPCYFVGSLSFPSGSIGFRRGGPISRDSLHCGLCLPVLLHRFLRSPWAGTDVPALGLYTPGSMVHMRTAQFVLCVAFLAQALTAELIWRIIFFRSRFDGNAL